MTRCTAIIPARYGSTRLPGKPLLRETGRPLIQHVYQRVQMARKVERIVVATDDQRIVAAVESFGGEAMMTAADHPTGTDRVAEVTKRLEATVILNVQGDEPDIDPALLDRLVTALHEENSLDLATAAVPIMDRQSLESPHVVKVVVDRQGRALYFSRAPIPHGEALEPAPLKHIGVYAYRREALLRWTSLAPVDLEKKEKLEQLRVLYHGMPMGVLITDKDHLGIDTQEEYDAFVRRIKKLT